MSRTPVVLLVVPALWLAAVSLAALGPGVAFAEDAPLPPPSRPVPPLPSGPTSSPGASPSSSPPPVPAPRAAPVPAPVPSPSAVATSSGVSDYRLVAGDQVTIEVILPAVVEAEAGTLFRTPTTVVVSNGGVVDLPRSPGVRLDGRTRAEVRADVQRNLATNGVTSQAEVLVNVTKYAPRLVYVVGAVNQTVEISSFARTTILQVFAKCGEAMRDADMRLVQIASRGSRRTIDVRAVLRSGGTSADAYVEADDVVILEEKPPRPEIAIPSVYIGGFVRSPGAYRLYDSSQTNQPITLLKAIFLAGGFADFAYQDEVVVRRSVGGQIVQQVYDLERVLRGKKGATNADADIPLQQGDIVYVRGSG